MIPTATDLGITNGNIRFYNVREEPFRIYGLYKPFVRIPPEVAAATNDGVKGLNNHTAGGRVRFTTTSRYVAIHMENPWSAQMTNMTLMGSSGFDVYASKNGRDTFVSVMRPPFGYKDGYDSLVWLPNNPKNEVTINFPLYSGVTELYVGLDADATVERRADYRFEKPVVYYGSSITQGGCASRPGLSYQGLISRRLDCNFINLGFSGSARGEDAIADYMASMEYSVFVMDYDHNAPNVRHLQNTHEKLYQKIRAAHPDVPVIMVGKPDFRLSDTTALDRRDVIYATYENARERGEKVIFIDGYSLFSGEMRDDCTVDGCHPNDIGMMRMADIIGKAVEYALAWN